MDFSRRQLITAGTLAVTGLAGCGSQQGQDTPTSEETPTTSPPQTPATSYNFQAATWDTYWYSLYNMFNTISLAGNGILFPTNDQQKETFQKRVKGIMKHSDIDRVPVIKPNLNMAPFTEGDPHFTQSPVYNNDGRPDASTLMWDRRKSSKVVSPASLAWTHLKGITWVKNFEHHFDVLPTSMAAKFKSQMLATIAQLGIKFALVDGKLRKNDDNMLLVSGFNPNKGVVDDTPRPRQYSAMLWFMSNIVSTAKGGWFGYKNPEPLIPPNKLQMMTDGVGKTIINAFSPSKIVEMGSTRDLGDMLGAIGWYGTHAGSEKLQGMAADYANGLADAVIANLAGHGRVEAGAANQAATQGIVAQGLVWASQIDGVDHTDTADNVIGYLLDNLWDAETGTFTAGLDSDTYTVTAQDAGDITGGLNAAEAELGRSEVKDIFPQCFNQLFNRGRLQRAEMPQSHNKDAQYSLPLPPKAGGEYGQAPVYNAEVTYDIGGDEWTITDAMFDTEQALYLANQDVWLSQWGGSFYRGRGVPGKSDTPA